MYRRPPGSITRFLYTSYDLDNEMHVSNKQGWLAWFAEHGDHEDYPDPECWFIDMLRMGLLIPSKKNTRYVQ